MKMIMKCKSAWVSHRNWLIVLLSIIATALVLIIINRHFQCRYSHLSSLSGGKLTDAQEQTIILITELNKYVLAINTLLIGGLGFYLTQWKDRRKSTWVQPIYIGATLMFLYSVYYGYRIIAELVQDMSQNALALNPDYSNVFSYLELSMVASAFSCLLLLSLFIMGITMPEKD